MPLYRITAPNGLTYEIEGPDGASDADVASAVLSQHPEAGQAPKAAPFSLADTALAAAQGLTGAAKGVASAFGAENVVAEKLGEAQKYLGEAISPERKAEIQRRALLEQQAAKSGSTMQELSAFLGGVKEAPIQAIAQGVGSSVPAVLAGLATVVAGAPAAIAGAVALGARALFGAIQGAGEVKGDILSAVEQGLIDKGMDPAEARKQAIAAQDYLGKNTANILAGAGLGAVAGGTGIESVLGGALAKQGAKEVAEGMLKRGAKEAAKEALPESLQGGQGQYAQNVALGRAGVETPAFQGVLGAAARDAAIGALTGAAVSPIGRTAPQPPTPEPTPTPETPPTAEAATLPTTYAGLVQELETLRQQAPTEETTQRMALLADAMKDMDRAAVEEQRLAAEQAKVDEEKARQSAFAAEQAQVKMRDVAAAPVPAAPEVDLFGQPVQRAEPEAEPALPTPKELEAAGQMRLPLRRTAAGKPTTTGAPEPTITAEDVMLTAIPLPSGARQWVEANVWGRTRTQLQDLVKRQPDLVKGPSPRARLMRVLTAPDIPAFQEAPNARTPTTAPAAAQPAVEPRGSEPSLAVPSEPARAEPAQPRAAAAAAAPQPVTPDGLGLVPAEQPARKGRAAKKPKPGALTPYDQGVQTALARPDVDAYSSPYKEGTTDHEQWMAGVLDVKYPTTAPVAAAPTAKTAPAKKVAAPAPTSAFEALARSVENKPTLPEEAPAAPAAAPAVQSPFNWRGAPSEFGAELQKKADEESRRSVTTREGQSLDALKTEVRAAPGKLGNALRRMVQSGKVVLEEKHPSGQKIGGVFDGKKVTLYADGIPSGEALAVALHEVGAHMGLQKLLGENQYNAVIDRIIAMASEPQNSPQRALAQRALNRIPKEDQERGADVARDEAVAYFVEELAKAEASGELPKIGPLRNLWNQIKTAIVTTVNKALGTNFGVADFTPQQIAYLADAALVKESKTGIEEGAAPKNMMSVSASTEALVDSMGPLDPERKSALKALITGSQTQADPDLTTKFRTQTADIAATIEQRLTKKFNGAVRDALGNLNPMGLYRQAQDYSKMLLEYFQQGALKKEKDTGLWKVVQGEAAPAEVYNKIAAWGKKNGYSFDRATQISSRILEGVRLNEMRKSNQTQGTEFLLHMTDAQIDQLVAEYNADPALKEISDAMDRPRKELVDHMVAVGRLTADEGKAWKEVIGYVPFDRVEDFSAKFNKTKKIGGKGISQLGKLPELVGSKERPVGNVFDNYLNTLGWMIGQITKNDASVQTLRALEDEGHAKFLGNSPQYKDNTASAYVGGEQMYWELPSKYDVMAFKDLTPPKAGYLRLLGEASNLLRTTVTALPPFALKQVADDIQRAIMTSGVKSPLALIRMSLTNFPKLALAELRGIRHPIVKTSEALGFTGAFDFVQGKPAASLLADMGYKPRGWLKEGLHRLEGITRASDLAVRKAIYDQTVKETGDALLAQTRAREFINFRRRGASDFVGAMVTTIPFFNAYVQGMDVLYRAASGINSSSSVDRAQARKLFWSRAAMVTALATLYAMGKDEDDEQYKEADLRTRDGNWFVGGIKFSVPGELGAIFKVIPERVVEYMKRQGTPEEQEASEAVRTALTYMFEQYVGRTVPIPQAAKPLLEAWTNYSFLTGRPLEGIHQRAMQPSMRRSEATSELALAISAFTKDQIGLEVSPIMIDNALRGYFGSTAAMTTMVTDSLLNPTRIDRPLHKYALLSNYLIDPVGTRRLGEFYEEREKVGQLNATLQELMKTDPAAADAFADKHEQALMMNSYINSTLEQLERTRAYRKYLNSKEGASEMSKEERTTEMEEVRRMEVELVSWLRDAKASIRKGG